MDQLFKRYADPFSLINGYIRTARFCDFIQAFAEEKKEDDRWEFFLHKVWSQSYTEFCEDLRTSQGLQKMSDATIEATVKKSMDILGAFNPEHKEGEDVNGFI